MAQTVALQISVLRKECDVFENAGGPGGTQTPNQTVMSGAPASRIDEIQRLSSHRVASCSFHVHGNRWRIGGKEIEMANERDYQPCARCGKVTHINDLDAKPESGIYDPNGDGDWTQLECAELCQQQIARRGLNYGN